MRFGETTAVNDINLSVESGEIVALLGPNGAGKTTTLESIQGYHAPDSGTISVFGLDPAEDRATIAQRWGVMPQSGGIPMGLTVREAVELFAALHGFTGDPYALVSSLGLDGLLGRRWRRLSGGEQQRLSLALALCGGTDLLLLDEPTAAVDAHGRRQVLDIIQERASAGAGVLITTHRFDDVEAIADRVVIIHRGRVVGAGDLDTLTASTNDIRFVAPAGLHVEQLSRRINRAANEVEDGRYVVVGHPDAQVIASITQWLADQGHTIAELQAGRRSLEEVFLELTTDTQQPDPDPVTGQAGRSA